MSTTSSTNFRDLYFEHKALTQIIGEPTFSTLYLMILQLKASASSVSSTLGSGQHNYIGVILSPVLTLPLPLCNLPYLQFIRAFSK